MKFNDLARAELAAGNIADISLGAWLDHHGYDEAFRRNYILPMGAAIWSTPEDKLLDYPAISFFQFFENHRLMHKERPLWRTVSGGSKNYVSRVADALGDRVRKNCAVDRIARYGNKVSVKPANGAPEIFDDVILAVHSNDALALLSDDFEARSFLLRSVRYRPNTIYLHRDPTLMPKRKAAWASWNVLKQESGDICLTYWMNKLQGLPAERPVLITLNPDTPPKDDLTFHKYNFAHPQFDAPAEAAVRALKTKQGQDGLWLAGAWMGRGFHEDGLKSGLAAALSLGGQVPWQAENVDISIPGKPNAQEGGALEAKR